MPTALTTAFIAFGANLGDPVATFHRVVPLLSQQGIGRVTAQSSLYETRALTLDGSTQPNYTNAVFAVETDKSAQEILETLLTIERTLGRVRDSEARWTPRAVDLDLLFVGSNILTTDSLTLPHPELHKRDFVLRPLAEIAPEFCHPCLGVSLRELEQTLDARGFERFVVRKVVGSPTDCD